MCNAQRGLPIAFIREVRTAPELSIVLTNDRKLHGLYRFIAKDHCWSFLGIDAAFNICKYNVTISTYHHPLLRTVGTNAAPVLMGPVLVNSNKTFHSLINVITIKTRITVIKNLWYWLQEKYLRFNENIFLKSRSFTLLVACKRQCSKEINWFKHKEWELYQWIIWKEIGRY